MKTRTLLMLSLGCGLAIMLAGAVLLFQLSGQEKARPQTEVGVSTEVGDMRVMVIGATEADGVLSVEIEIGGVDDDQPDDDFRLIASGRPELATQTTCAPTTATAQRCSLSFGVANADGTSRVLFYDRGDDQARWILG